MICCVVPYPSKIPDRGVFDNTSRLTEAPPKTLAAEVSSWLKENKPMKEGLLPTGQLLYFSH